MNGLDNDYFEWMCDLVGSDRRSKSLSYQKLLWQLHGTEFNYILPLDGNRAEDGIDLRYRFGREFRIDPAIIACEIDTKPCSVLEMMVSLAVRCEETIMTDPDIGDRTASWFWDMVQNLGLASMTDIRYDSRKVSAVLNRFLNREYDKNGNGGLFRVSDPTLDMRRGEIWYQLMWYLDEMSTKERR